MVVKGTTTSGIKFKLDSKIKDDARLLFLLTKAQNAEDTLAASEAVMKLLELVFGGQDNVYAFMCEVADKHKGVCDIKDMLVEIQEMFDAINAKNS